MASSPRGKRCIYESNGSNDWLVNHHRANFVRPVSSQRPSSFWARRVCGLDQDAELDGRRGFRVGFAELQRMKMRKLQIRLLRHAVTMTKTGTEPTKPKRSQPSTGHQGDEEPGWTSWEDDLAAYITAVRDYEYMIQFTGTADDPFVASSERRVDHKILQEEMREARIDFRYLAEEIDPPVVKAIPTGPWSADDEPIWGRRYLASAKNTWKRSRKRLLALLATGLFILLPGVGIILATLLPNQNNNPAARWAPFIIVLVATLGWGIIMIAKASQLKDVIGWTSAYAAVLGIFVTGAATLRQAVGTSAPSKLYM